MLDREPFLRAIFAAPDDDLPRLVFADWLDEHGDHTWAELIRVQCELARSTANGGDDAEALVTRETQLLNTRNPRPNPNDFDGFPHRFEGLDPERSLPPLPVRGFLRCEDLRTNNAALSDGLSFRTLACSRHPEWYGATRLSVESGRISAPEPLQTILTSPVAEHVVELDLSGAVRGLRPEDDVLFQAEYELDPTITVRMVERLSQMREVRRLTVLDLRNNNLDNDALHALAASTYFIRLKRLLLSTGNQFRGRTWQRVCDRFGPDVVE